MINHHSVRSFNGKSDVAKKACKERPATSLDAYKGEFGYQEAARLARVAGFGAPPALVNEMVNLGLERAVNRIIDQRFDEPILESQMNQLACDTYFDGEEEKDPCDPVNENDLSFDGLSTSFYHWAFNTQNQLDAKLTLFLNDYVATSYRVLSSRERHAANKHIRMLRRLAQSGDLITFLYEMVDPTRGGDHLTAQWLNLVRSTRFNPNEDFGREFLELFTIGKNDLAGNPRYGDAEIIASSLAFTGYKLVEQKTGQNSQGQDLYSYYLAFASDIHDNNQKVLWAGTPHQAVVYGAGDMVEAVKNHPGLAEFWALNLWKEFVNDKPSAAAIKEAAAYLRNHNYNIRELLRVYFKSKAFYAADSKNTLYKLPLEFALDIVRSLGMPAPHPRDYLRLVGNIGQKAFDPPTVFGWHTYADNYMNSRYVLGRRNLAMGLLHGTSSPEDLLEEHNFDFFRSILGDKPSAETLIDRYSKILGFSPNAAQREAMLHFMNYTTDYKGDVVTDLFIGEPTYQNAYWKTIGLMLLLIQQPEFGLK